MSDLQFERAVTDWLEVGSDRTPRRAIDGVLLAVKTTPQERDPRIPWRFPTMPALSRAPGIAAVALVAVVGAGGLIYLNSNNPGPGSQGTPAPTAAATVAALPSGIPGWTSYTSDEYGFTMSYPSDWRVYERASQRWSAELAANDDLSFAEKFSSQGTDEEVIGLLVWQMPAPEGLSVGSDDGGLNLAFATLCDSLRLVYESCGVLVPPEKLCLGPLGLLGAQEGCLPTLIGSIGYEGEETPHAFVLDPTASVVTVFWLARGYSFPAYEQYGGGTELLKAIVSELDAR